MEVEKSESSRAAPLKQNFGHWELSQRIAKCRWINVNRSTLREGVVMRRGYKRFTRPGSDKESDLGSVCALGNDRGRSVHAAW